jgi:phospholipase/carboxylesterase
MNRIQLPAPCEHALDVVSELESGVQTTSGGCRVPHAIFAPLHYESNYAYPLIVWLHGRGGDEHQLRRIMPLISMRNYVAVAPRGTHASSREGRGYEWRDSDEGSMAAAQRVFESIEAARSRFNIAPQRVFLAGFECGGSTAFRVAFLHPSWFAGVLSVGGPFPKVGNPLASLRQSRNLPVFIAQGRTSRQYPLDRTCEELRLFHAAGLSVTLRQYPCGDELNTKMLHDIDVWLMEQVTGVCTPSDEDSTTYFDFN